MAAYDQVLHIIKKFFIFIKLSDLVWLFFSSILTCNAYFRSRFISNYMRGNIDGLHRNIIQYAVSALRYLARD